MNLMKGTDLRLRFSERRQHLRPVPRHPLGIIAGGEPQVEARERPFGYPAPSHGETVRHREVGRFEEGEFADGVHTPSLPRYPSPLL